MKDLVFFTPSFVGDLQRFLLLRKSIQRFSKIKCKHFVVVPREDFKIFKERVDSDVVILIQNDFVDSYYYPRLAYKFIQKYFPRHAWRLARFGGKPGWITQQIVKLSIPEIASGCQVILLDSDIVFMRNFLPEDLGASEEKNVLLRVEPEVESAKQVGHIKYARELLGLPVGATDHHYMSWPNIWQSEWVVDLRGHLEKMYQKPWQAVLFDAEKLSEYSLYGVFVEEKLKPENLKINKSQLWKIIWDKKSFYEFFTKSCAWDSSAYCLIVQSNVGIETNEYEKYLNKIWS